MKDYQALYVENKTEDIKKNISECLMKAAEQRKKQTQPTKPQPVQPKEPVKI